MESWIWHGVQVISFLCVKHLFISCEAIEQKYQYSTLLDPNGHFQLNWTVNYIDQDVNFHLTVQIKPRTWFAMGFSNYGDVTQADLLVHWTDNQDVHHVFDAHTDRSGILLPDQSQDYHVTAISSHWDYKHKQESKVNKRNEFRNLWHRTSRDPDNYFSNHSSGRQIKRRQRPFKRRHEKYLSRRHRTAGARYWYNGLKTHHRQHRGKEQRKAKQREMTIVINFSRNISTCDPDDYIFDNGTTHIIYIMGHQTSRSPLGRHLNNLDHGIQRVQLLKPELVEPRFPEDTWTFEIRAPNITIPAKETTYWWQTMHLPEIKQKHHIIKYEGVIAPGSGDLVHHMEVFHCEVKEGTSIPHFSGPGLGEGKPEGLGVCRHVIGAWAMGAQAMVYPTEAGVPVGGEGYSKFVLLEVHYNNPETREGVVDTSGIRFYVTSQLRQYEAGIMELGLEYTNKMAIPPRQKNFPLSGYCVPDCTAKGLPEQGIKVFASQLHTHLTGRRVITRHVTYDEGQATWLPDLNRDNHYSSHFQEIRRLQPPVSVRPGDALITTCEYDTRERVNATVGGFAISDEMCVNYIHYYPRTDLEVCKSSVETRALDTFFFFLNRILGERVSPALGYRTSYTNIQWTQVTAHLLDQLYTSSPLSMQCNASDGSRLPGFDWEHSSLTSWLPTKGLGENGESSTVK